MDPQIPHINHALGATHVDWRCQLTTHVWRTCRLTLSVNNPCMPNALSSIQGKDRERLFSRRPAVACARGLLIVCGRRLLFGIGARDLLGLPSLDLGRDVLGGAVHDTTILSEALDHPMSGVGAVNASHKYNTSPHSSAAFPPRGSEILVRTYLCRRFRPPSW